MSASDWSELDGYEALVSELRANPPVAPERLRQRVLEGAPAPRRQRSRKRKLVLVVVPAAVVLAVGAALVHGFVSSGSHSNATSARSAVLGQNPRVLGPPSRGRVPGRQRRSVSHRARLTRRTVTSHENVVPTGQDSAAGADALGSLYGRACSQCGHDPEEPARACRRLAPGRGEELEPLGQDERGVADRRLVRRLRAVRPLPGIAPG